MILKPEIKEMFIPAGRTNRPGDKLQNTKGITVHDTGNKDAGADAEAHGQYFRSDAAANRPVSCHFTVDDSQIVQHIPLDETSYHAGDGRRGPGNSRTISVEICENQDGDREQAEKLAARLVAWLLDEILSEWGTNPQIFQHYDWNGSNCPRVLRSRPQGWEEFLEMVDAQFASDMFEDVPADHWAAGAVYKLWSMGLLKGRNGNKFAGEEPATRYELAEVAARILQEIEKMKEG